MILYYLYSFFILFANIFFIFYIFPHVVFCVTAVTDCIFILSWATFLSSWLFFFISHCKWLWVAFLNVCWGSALNPMWRLTSSFWLVMMYDTHRFARTMALTLRIYETEKQAVYSFSQRKTIDKTQSNHSEMDTATFQHHTERPMQSNSPHAGTRFTEGFLLQGHSWMLHCSS